MPNSKAAGRSHLVAHVLLTLAIVAGVLAVAALFSPWELAIGDLVLRSEPDLTHSFPAPETGGLETASRRRDTAVDPEIRPRNVILVIGDGMGIGQISTASALLKGPRGGLAIESAPVTGLVSTFAGDRLVTDSAAASTAMATGFKVPKRAISVLPDGRIPVTLFEAARRSGMTTGFVTTAGLVDATPAGFTAHERVREAYSEILRDMLASGTEVLVGGDWSASSAARKNSEFVDLIARIDSLGAEAGYTVVRDPSELRTATVPVLAVFPPRGKGGDAHGPRLTELAVFAVERLKAVGNGFLLLIESEVTDGMGHDNQIAGLVDGVRELDDAVAAILAWAAPRGDTLVLVTADHDTGGLGIVGGRYNGEDAEVRWATDNHTAQWVPLFAFGPGSECFSGVIDNTDIAILIAKLIGIGDFPSTHP
jgi:alkaline phosphatase